MQNTNQQKLFDHRKILASMERAKRINKKDADFLIRLAIEVLSERLSVTNRDFDRALDVFSPFGCAEKLFDQTSKISDPYFLHLSHEKPFTGSMVAELDTLPIADETLNLATSVFSLHWSNDLPGMFAQIRRALAPDGLFLCVLPGDQTLRELRECLIEAETKLCDSVSLRVDPFGDIRQFGGLLQRAGFSLPVVDTEIYTVRYASMFELIKDLRAMGVTGNLNQTKKFGPRGLFDEAAKIYSNKFSDEDGRIRATFEMVFLSGWAPHASQQKPLKPGIAEARLKDFL
ncbi:MAG: methyltransferase domain-containing protein [Pseudomonadota bacterium]